MKNSDNNLKSMHLDFLLLDIISMFSAFALSYRIKFGLFDFFESETWMPLLYIVLLLNIVISLFSKPNEDILKRPYYEEIIRSVLLSFYNLLASSVLFYVLKIGMVFSRQMILTMYVLFFGIGLILKCIWKRIILSGKIKLFNVSKTKLLIVSDSENFEESIVNAEAGDISKYIISCVCLDEIPTKSDLDISFIKWNDDIVDYIVNNSISEVLIASEKFEFSSKLCTELINRGIGIHFGLDSILGFSTEDYEVDNVGAFNTLTVGNFSFSIGQNAYIKFKRLIDVFIGAVGTLFLLPVALIVKLMFLLTGDKEKIFYKQTRVGINGKNINIYKFRTMVPGADKMLNELLKDEKIKEEWDRNQKISNDPRITKIGSFLRKTSIDELPQLINVLKGDMSLVGPRPLVIGELETHNGMSLYQRVKPGITGWWGCNGRSNIDYRERLELEYYYVKNISLYLDFLCILRTILSVVKRDGAE